MLDVFRKGVHFGVGLIQVCPLLMTFFVRLPDLLQKIVILVQEELN